MGLSARVICPEQLDLTIRSTDGSGLEQPIMKIFVITEEKYSRVALAIFLCRAIC